MKFPPFLHSHLRLTLLGTPPNRVFSWQKSAFYFWHLSLFLFDQDPSFLNRKPDKQGTAACTSPSAVSSGSNGSVMSNFEVINSALLTNSSSSLKFPCSILVRLWKSRKLKMQGQGANLFSSHKLTY